MTRDLAYVHTQATSDGLQVMSDSDKLCSHSSYKKFVKNKVQNKAPKHINAK